MSNSYTVDKMLYKTDCWSIIDNDTFLAHTTDDDFLELDVEVSASELNELHPLFADAVRASVEQSRTKFGRAYVFGNILEATLLYLSKGAVTFKDTYKTERHYLSIDDIVVPEGSYKEVWIKGTEIYLETANIGGIVVPFVTICAPRQSHVLNTHLDELYPGWERRLKICLELGVEKEELFNQVFTTNSLVVPNFTDITFD